MQLDYTRLTRDTKLEENHHKRSLMTDGDALFRHKRSRMEGGVRQNSEARGCLDTSRTCMCGIVVVTNDGGGSPAAAAAVSVLAMLLYRCAHTLRLGRLCECSGSDAKKIDYP